MARVPPPHHDVDRGLWIPDLRKGSFSPLRSCQSSLPANCPSQRLPTPRLCRCDLSVTFPIRFPPCAGGSSQSSWQSSHVAHVVERKQRDVHVAIYDTVLLSAGTKTEAGRSFARSGVRAWRGPAPSVNVRSRLPPSS